ncbi:hypothetical protein ABKN59_011380 [Abortiporus biennis]
MPLEVLFEIFCSMHPRDLLHLSRATKAFRAVLTNKYAIRFWKASFRYHAKQLPPRFPNMNELALANLWFSPHCHNCLRQNIRDIMWDLRARYCNMCKRSALIRFRGPELQGWHVLRNSSGVQQGSYLIHWEKFLSISSIEYEGAGTWYFADPKEREELTQKEWTIDKGFNDEKTRERIFEERKEFLKNNSRIARKCESWEDKQFAAREKEIHEIRVKRIAAIFDKLRELGYEKELDDPMEEAKTALLRETVVLEPKALTDRAWPRIQKKVIPIMEHSRRQLE